MGVNQNILGGLTVAQTKELIELLIWRGSGIIIDDDDAPAYLASVIFETLVRRDVLPLTDKEGNLIGLPHGSD
jgi:hypothetical protein